MNRRQASATAVIAASGAAAYAVSPLTVVFSLALAAIVALGVRGIGGRERLLVGGLLVSASALRLAAVAGIFLATDPWVEPFHAIFGDARYSIERSLWVRNMVLGADIGAHYRFSLFNPYGGNVFHYYLAYLQMLFEPSPYAVTLLSVVAFIGASVLLHRRARTAFGSVPAGIGLALLLFWPTFFVWSVSMLKESTLLLLSATAIVCLTRLPAARAGWPRIGAALGGAAAVIVLATLREGALTVTVGGIAAGAILWVSVRRTQIAALVVVSMVVAIAVAYRTPAIRARVGNEVALAISRHIGHWGSTGISYRIADDRFYTDGREAEASTTPEEGARFLLRAVAAFVLVPLPQHVDSTAGWVVLPEQFLWLALVAFGIAGAWVGVRRDPLVTSVFVGYCLVAAAVIAPNSGNVGTLMRHRDTVVPFLVWLSAVGIEAGLTAIWRRLPHDGAVRSIALAGAGGHAR